MNPKIKRPAIRLNKTEIEALPPEGADYFVSVEGWQGLTVRVTVEGVRSFVMRYRVDGRQGKHVLGQYPAMTPEGAKKAHARVWGLIHAGTDPNAAKAEKRRVAAEARLALLTVGDLLDRYKAEHSPDNSECWQAESSRLMERHIRPAMGKLPLKAIGPAEVSSLLYAMKGTPTQANRTRAVLRSMFQRAEEWGLRPLGTNPVSVVKVRGKEEKRNRRLSDLELKKLGEAFRTSTEAPEVKAGIRLALMAGMRKGEIQGCRWDWVDLQAGTITIPPSSHKTGKKTGKVRIVHLCPELVEELKNITKTLGCPYLIPGSTKEEEDGKLIWKPFTALQNPWERLRVAAKLAEQGKPSEDDPGLHDLRRTFGSVAADLGLKGFAAELLGHAEATVTDIYTRAAADRLHEAAGTIGARIGALLAGTIDPEKEALERVKASEKNDAKRA